MMNLIERANESLELLRQYTERECNARWECDMPSINADDIADVIDEMLSMIGKQNPALSISKKDDGYWLNINGSYGCSASIHIDTKGPIAMSLLGEAAEAGRKQWRQRTVSNVKRWPRDY